MARVVDESQTREYIKILTGFVENGARELAKARRWPWKRERVPGLLYEMAHNLVVRGINECLIGAENEARASFSRAIELATERFKTVERVFLGYHDVQVIAAAVVAGRWREAEAAAGLALAISGGTHSNEVVVGPNAGTRVLLAWLNRATDVIRAERDAAHTRGLEQFGLWADIAWYASNNDVQGAQKALEELAVLVRKDVRTGDSRYSEDRHAYLPGQLLLLLASRDSLAVTAPNDPWWQACPLDAR